MQLSKETNNKVFVGNVPFVCNREEFINCFSNLDGFVDADIILRYGSNLSRGFGFVIFETDQQVNKLLERNDIQIGNRTLRFTKYIDHNTFIDKKQSENIILNKLFIKDLPITITNKILFDDFSIWGNILNIFINHNGTGTAVITFVDNNSVFECLKNETRYNCSNYRKKKNYHKNQQQVQQHLQPAVIYREGFRAGELIGYQKGYNAALLAIEKNENNI